MAVKVVVLCLVLGVPTALTVWAAVRIRRAYLQLRAGYQDSAVNADTATRAVDGLYSAAGMADCATEIASGPIDWDSAGLSAPIAVCAEDRDYYQTCWEHILGTFAHWPAIGLDLAGRLTVNLMLNRGLAATGRDLFDDLPAHWHFPTAQGYREAQSIARRAATEDLPREELIKGLMLYRALFEEILAAPTSAEALR